MTATEDRIETMEKQEAENFINQAASILGESCRDSDVTNDEHKELFQVFLQKADKFFPDPSSTEMAQLKNIAWTRHSKNV